MVCTKEDGSITFAQKSFDKLTQAKKIAPIFAAKQPNKIIEIQSFQIPELIHQQLCNYYFFSKIAINSKTITLILSVKSIKRIRSKVDYRYRYIFSCLYPKHTFW